MQNFLDNIKACAPSEASITWQPSFAGPSLPSKDTNNNESLVFIEQHNLVHGEPVGFWTEAALFNAAGFPALVLGPGDIAQAHSADEYVLKEQLLKAFGIYERVSRPAE
jgi:acetylornithine deacetylase